ncbi:peptidase M3, partial [Pirellulales bacterium]|nr:peptidase M3 [Pirellulales bacterium]
MPASDFATFQPSTPVLDEVAEQYRQLHEQLDAASDAAGAIAAVQAWDALLRQLYTWSAVVEIRYYQDTQNPDYQKAREHRDQLDPKLTDLAVAMKRRLMESSHRGELADRFGAHVLDLWKCDAAAFNPVIEDDLVEQSRLSAEYTGLLAGARFDFRGESLTLSELRKFAEHPERDVRYDAEKLRWGWFGEQRSQLDGIFSQLVDVRHGMANKLGYDSYTDLGYLLMHRVDYDAADVERFRAEIRKHVVPLCVQIRERQAARIGVDPLMAWDEGLSDPAGNPKPQG